MDTCQPGILLPIPSHARFMSFRLKADVEIDEALDLLVELVDGTHLVAGLGGSLLGDQTRKVDGMRDFPSYAGYGVEVPATPASLWCWVRGEERGGVFMRAHSLERRLAGYFEPLEVVDAFRHAGGRDLSGYRDGTENPEGDEAIRTAFVAGQGDGMDGSSFVAVQRWQHDFAVWDRLDRTQRDNIIGRRLTDNEELEDAPPSAHVKRTEQESFSPEAFVLRRSMPWASGSSGGLYFTAFGHSLNAFEAQLRRMVGHEDGIVDATFQFSHPLTGSYFWCPPMKDGELNLAAVVQ